ncbi:MAG: Chaperone DnaJ domain protein [Candidatus Roizmanbacteria bacterium GW2011_GWA2_35_19]|uniref:Chaperone DnaJ domain protein n=2 Tax=Candidatus Roizmaniibacteriota TaxID=1752723 RepID=A0A0G0EEY0_9BACT|nr:MAG: Chaperone DnaJ domain protein [Candidatus Roizmanbacteria bacterium GW2011_GWC2_35_12]KKP73750.1 MAG: Chaperone DnaJ domain protein [Candidatus Roizmanbacteria bacterium GW2011_GWA2_35_19]
MTNYYEILGIAKGSTDQEIKSAYKKQALKWHPDRNKASDATAKFKEINKAYEVLSNPQKKQMYDQYGESAFERGGMGGQAGQSGGQYYQQGPFKVYTDFSGGGFENVDFGGFSDPFEIFEQFFGFQSPFSRGGRRQARREIFQINLTFDEAVHGTEKQTVIKGETKNIKIPAGVANGMTIRFSDFDLQVQVKPHPYFKREGQDIYFEKEISYPFAVLGGNIEVPTIDGMVKLKVRPGTESGTRVRLRGQGVPNPQTYNKGDQYVIFKVSIPSRVTSRGRKLLEELENEL